MNIIEIESISFAHQQQTIFSEMSLSIPAGKITAILGPSGTGKTTLLKLMTGYFKPDQGRILLSGEDISLVNRDRLYALRREIGFLFQSSALFSNYSVYDNVAFPLRELTALPESLIRHIVLMNLESVGLRGACRLYPNELSGGMSRRVALARAIALDPKLMLYDEPFTGQDPISMGILMRLIKDLNQTFNMTSVLVSHDVKEAMHIADKVYVISGGNVLAEGDANDLMHSDSTEVQQFIRGLPDGPVAFHYPATPLKQDLLL